MRDWILVLTAWTMVGLFRGGNRVLAARLAGVELDARTTPLFDPLLAAWVWALWTPLVALLRRRFPLVFGPSAAHTARTLAAHLAAGPVFAFLHSIVLQPAMVFIKVQTTDFWCVYGNTRFNFIGNLLALTATYLVLAGALQVVANARRTQGMALSAERLKAELLEERFAALRARLDPAALAASFETLGQLIPKDPNAAEDLIVRMGDALRRVYEDEPEAAPSGIARALSVQPPEAREAGPVVGA